MKIITSFKENHIGETYITDYALIETIDTLLRKTNFNHALNILDLLTNTQRIKIIYINEQISKRILEFFKIYKTLSLTDCSLVTAAEQYEIKDIFSFDDSFDSIKRMKRQFIN